MVHTRGLEPPISNENYHLKVARIPIPPRMPNIHFTYNFLFRLIFSQFYKIFEPVFLKKSFKFLEIFIFAKLFFLCYVS